MERPQNKGVLKKGERELGIILLVLAVGMLLFAILSGDANKNRKQSGYYTEGEQSLLSVPPHKSPEVQRNLNIDRRIDRELKTTSERIRFGAAKTALENEIAPPVGIVPSQRANVHKIQLDQEKHGQDVVRELEREKEPYLTPDERIRRKQSADQWNEDYDRRYENEFVRQFQENARKQGYQIRVNDDLDVTGLSTVPLEKPIRVPQSLPATNR